MKIKDRLKLAVINRQIKKRFPETQIKLLTCIDPDRLELGKASYGELSVVSFNLKSKLIIGNYCSVAQKVTFLLDVDHPMNQFSTYPFRVKFLNTHQFEAISKGDIFVGDDVWIGYGATILSGVNIGQGAVIAAGALVTHNVPPHEIWGGCPAKCIRQIV